MVTMSAALLNTEALRPSNRSPANTIDEHVIPRENGRSQLSPPALTRGIKRSNSPPIDYSPQRTYRRTSSPTQRDFYQNIRSHNSSPSSTNSLPVAHLLRSEMSQRLNGDTINTPPADRRISPPQTDRRPADKDRQTSSPTQNSSQYRNMTGVPQPALPTRLTAPVHLDIGGTIYTSTLAHLTRHEDSKLAKLFNGSIPVILDTMKQHYFIDRDGPTFRHILNYLRNGKLILPDGYKELSILEEEAKYYELEDLLNQIDQYKRNKVDESVREVLTVSMCPDLGERISLSGKRSNIEDCFPELKEALTNSRNTGWATSDDYILRFPVNGFSKLNSVQVVERLLSRNFTLTSSTGGGVEGQQFSELLFTRSKSARS